MTTSAETLAIILKALPAERVDLFLNRIENKLPLFVASAKDIGTIGKTLPKEQFKLFLTHIKALGLNPIKSARDVQNVVNIFSSRGCFFEGRDERCDTFIDAIEDQFPELASSVEAFQMIASHLSKTMLSKFSNVMQNKLPEQITSVEAFYGIAGKYFFTSTHPMFFDTMQMKLPELIGSSAEKLGQSIQMLPGERGMALFNTMKPKLAEILTDEMDIVDLLERTGNVPGLHAEVAKYLQDANPELLSGITSWYSNANAVEELVNPSLMMNS